MDQRRPARPSNWHRCLANAFVLFKQCSSHVTDDCQNITGFNVKGGILCFLYMFICSSSLIIKISILAAEATKDDARRTWRGHWLVQQYSGYMAALNMPEFWCTSKLEFTAVVVNRFRGLDLLTDTENDKRQVEWAWGLLCLYADDSQHCCDSHLIHSYLLCVPLCARGAGGRHDESVSPHFPAKIVHPSNRGFCFCMNKQ